LLKIDFYSYFVPDSDMVDWARGTKSGRLDSNPSRTIPKTWKTILAAYPALCSVLMGGCKGTHGVAIHSPSFTHHQCSIQVGSSHMAHRAIKELDEHYRPIMTLQKEYKNKV